MRPGHEAQSSLGLLRGEIEALRRELERARLARPVGDGILEAILNHSAHGIVVCDGAGKVIVQNRASERIWAGSATVDTVDAWRAYRAYHPDGRPYAPSDWSMAKCLRHGEAVDFHEVDMMRFDGSRGFLLASCAPIFGEAGEIAGAVSVFADITRSKELEAALRASHLETELLFRLTDAVVRSETVEEIFEHALDAVLSGLQAERASILVFDDERVMRFRAWRGLSAEYRRAVDGHSPWTAETTEAEPVFVEDAESDGTMESYRSALRAENIRALGFFPLLHRRRLLGKFMVYSPTPRAFSDRERRLALAIGSQVAQGLARRSSDIEIGRLLARATAAQDVAERAVRARDELLAVVSHDLRNPVNTLSLSATNLMATATTQQDHRLHQQAQRMQRSLGTMNRLIGDLLDVGAIDGGSLQVHLRQDDLGAIVNDAVDLMRPLADERSLEVIVDAPPGIRALADRERVVQVVANIVGNAIKFTPVGGRISVRVSQRELEGRLTAEVEVTDTGPGIAEEHLPRIFERFWRPKQERQGVGLGLAIAKGIVEAHGGRLSVESRPGDGATFRFTLPVG